MESIIRIKAAPWKYPIDFTQKIKENPNLSVRVELLARFELATSSLPKLIPWN